MTFRFLRAAALASVVAAALAPVAPAQAEPVFSEVVGFAAKTGFRGVFAWQATQPVEGIVHYGTSPTKLARVVEPTPNVAAAAQMAVVDDLAFPGRAGRTWYFQVEDKRTGQRSEIVTLDARNAYTNWDTEDGVYTLNLVVQLDTQDLPDTIDGDQGLRDIAASVNILAERTYDALDGFARIGKVIVTDTLVDVPAGNALSARATCAPGSSYSDVVFESAPPFDSHTSYYGIERGCANIFLGRQGWLVANRWPHDLEVGYTATHELMHYGFGTPDLYNVGGGFPTTDACRNLEWDGSLMHNSGGWNPETGRWELTELDRNPTLTPCAMDSQGEYSWETARSRYVNVPERATGPIEHIVDTQARGNEDGGELEIWILDRTPTGSSLSRFTPDDALPVP